MKIKPKAIATTFTLLCGLTPAAMAQIPGAGGAAAAAGPAAAAASPVTAPGSAAAAAAGQRNIWSFFCMTPEQKLACKEKICATTFGQFLNNGLKGPSAFTGGIIPECCPPVKSSDLLKPADSAEGAADKIKRDEMESKARRAAARYLGTVDCRYWPEAQEGLINALRADRNECVRMEAAYSLSRGCCCNKATMLALILTVSGSDSDGNPCEPSERVKIAAEYALKRCLECFVETKRVPVAEPLPPATPAPQVLPLPTVDEKQREEKKEKEKGSEKPADADKANVTTKKKAEDSKATTAAATAKPKATTPAEYYKRADQFSAAAITIAARKALNNGHRLTATAEPTVDPDSRSLAAIISKSVGRPSTPPPPLAESPSLPHLATVPSAGPSAPVTQAPAQQVIVQPVSKPRGFLGKAMSESATTQRTIVSSPTRVERPVVIAPVVTETKPTIVSSPILPAPAPMVTQAEPTAPLRTVVVQPAGKVLKVTTPETSEPTRKAPMLNRETPKTEVKTIQVNQTYPVITEKFTPNVLPSVPAPTSALPLPAAPAKPVVVPAVETSVPTAMTTQPSPEARKVEPVTVKLPAPVVANPPVTAPVIVPKVEPEAVKLPLPAVSKETLAPVAAPPVVQTAAPIPTVPAPAAQSPVKIVYHRSEDTPRSVQFVPAPQPAVQPERSLVQAAPTGFSKGELLAILQWNVHPDRREWAVEQLGNSRDAGTDRQVIQTLLHKAVSDTAPLVRVACMNSIQKLKIVDYKLPEVINRLKSDSDPRVRQSAEQASTWLHSTTVK